MKSIVFVVGTGRTGTHWIGHSLHEQDNVKTLIEINPMFRFSKLIATSPRAELFLYPLLALCYRFYQIKYRDKLIIEKSHPNLWIVEKLSKSFPNSKFIFTQRDPFSVVSSMLLHKEVMHWINNWEQYPIPNRFLGIDKDNAEDYAQMSLLERCVVRWQAHENEKNKLINIIGAERCFVLDFEQFVENTKTTFNEITEFIDIKFDGNVPEVDRSASGKWKLNLDAGDINIIQQMTGVDPKL